MKSVVICSLVASVLTDDNIVLVQNAINTPPSRLLGRNDLVVNSTTDDLANLETGDLDLDLFREDFEELNSAFSLPERDGVVSTPVRREVRTRPVMWVHIHKAAGHYVCGTAKINGEHIVEPNANCNWVHQDDGGGGLRLPPKYEGNPSCVERYNYFKKNQYTWGQTERATLDKQHWCFGHFDYMIWLRDPMTLAESEVNHAHYTADEVAPSIDCLEAENATDCVKHLKVPKRDDMPLWQFFDNHVVRFLGGKAVYNLPPGGITEQHATDAIALLEKFKVTAVMETAFSTEQRTAAFFDRVGWDRLPSPSLVKKASKGKDESYKRPHTVAFTQAQQETLRKVNKYDYMVYDWAKRHAP